MPTAVITGDSTVDVGQTAYLDGTGSSDPEDDPLTYSWELFEKPGGSTATLSDPTSPEPTLTPDIAGVYKVRLIVNDGDLDSAPATFDVTATAAVVVTAVDDVVPVPPAIQYSDQPATIAVLANDSPAGVTVGSLTQPANGEAVLNGDGTITYRQAGLAFEEAGLVLYKVNCMACHGAPEFTGTDTFTYTATNGSNSDSATVTVNVTSLKSFGTAPILTSATQLDSCSDLPSINAHANCRGLSNAQIVEIRDFLDQGF